MSYFISLDRNVVICIGGVSPSNLKHYKERIIYFIKWRGKNLRLASRLQNAQRKIQIVRQKNKKKN